MPSPDINVSSQLPIGAQTMSPAMASMSYYCDYLYRQLENILGQRVWEIGAGHGVYTETLLHAGKTVLACDIDEDCLAVLQQRYTGNPHLTLSRIDLRDQTSIDRLADFSADSIFCVNVLEHIEDDVSALRWLREAVPAEARLGLIVPAHPMLYGRMDQEAGHFRRYTRSTLQAALVNAGWTVQHVSYLNIVGALGWWYHNRVRHTAGLADEAVNRQMLSTDRWLPRFARYTDPICGRLMGLSVLAHATAVTTKLNLNEEFYSKL